MMIRYMRPLPTILLIGVALLLLAAAPAAGWVALLNFSFPDGGVGVLNYDQNPVDLTGWTITDAGAGDMYTFPHFTLGPWALVTVHPGRGTDSATDLYWSGGPAHSATGNSGDLVTLRDASGTRIADSRGFVLGAPTLPRTPVTTMPLVTMVTLPGYVPLSPLPTPYVTLPLYPLPTGVAYYGPIASPYPTTIPTGPTTVPTTVPIPRLPAQGIALPTGSPLPVPLPTGVPGVTSLQGAKRYAIGDPGSLLGTRFGANGSTALTRMVRTIATTDLVLKPGSVSFGVTPPASGSFVRWYPAERWAAEQK